MSAAEAVLKGWDACSKTDTLFILVCSVFCWPIIPAVGLGYSGYSTRRSGLASFMPSILSVAVCTIQWFVIGYTLAYGEGGAVFGDLKNAFHIGVLSEPVGTIPAILFSEFQLIFEATVCAIAVGGACERGRLLPIIPFILVRSPFPLLNYVLTCIAVVNIHILPVGTYGLGRRFPRRTRSSGLRGRNSRSYMQRCYGYGTESVLVISHCAIKEV